MTIKQLQYFIAVAETLNFTKAAQRCFISQTAMTQQIKSLEDKIGVPLFIRDKHHVSLTSAGKVYLSEARAILSRSEEAVKLARTAAEGISGNITIGFIRGYELSNFGRSLRYFHSGYPNIKIHLIRDNMSALYNQLEDGACDITFNLSQNLQQPENMQHRFLKSYPLMLILYPGHRLAEKQTILYRELEHEDFIIMQPKGRANEETEEVMLCFNRGGFIPNIVEREREAETILLMVSAGMGIAVLPEYAVRYFQDTPNLVIRPLVKEDGTPELINFEMTWHETNTNPALGTLLAWLERHHITE